MLNERYRIVRALGQGGMGTVYLAQHERLDTPVAVKEVRGESTNPEEYQHALDQASKEARFLVKLNHANLPKVTDMFTENGRFYLVMEYIQGVTLEAKLWENGSQPLDPKSVVNWALQIADVLAYLHSQDPPIIFRDLKPANIMLQPDSNVRLIDFGIARRFTPGASKDTQLLGSVGYSPPEQFGKHQTDTRSDVYAFGATLHHLLTGRDPSAQPFKFPPAHSINPAVPETLSRLLERCLAMDAEQRPRSVQEVAYQLMMIRDELARPPVTPSAAHSSSGAARAASGRGGAVESTSKGHPSRDVARPPSGPVMSQSTTTGSLGSPRNLAIAACVLFVIGVPTAYFMTRPHASTPPSGYTGPANVNRGVNGGSGGSRTGSQGTGAGGSQSGQLPLPPPSNSGDNSQAHDSQVTFQPGQSDIVADGQGAFALRTSVTGVAKNYASSSANIAVFFYDASGNPLAPRNAPDSSTGGGNRGQVAVQQAIQIAEDGSFQGMLSESSSQFPPAAANGIKCKFVLYVNSQPVGQSEMTDVQVSFPQGFFGADSSGGGNGQTPGDSGAGAR
jgi:serine/threonine protein kinase